MPAPESLVAQPGVHDAAVADRRVRRDRLRRRVGVLPVGVRAHLAGRARRARSPSPPTQSHEAIGGPEAENPRVCEAGVELIADEHRPLRMSGRGQRGKHDEGRGEQQAKTREGHASTIGTRPKGLDRRVRTTRETTNVGICTRAQATPRRHR